MGLDDNYQNRQLDEHALQIETPLVASLNSHIRQHFKTALYPYNATIAAAAAAAAGGHFDDDGNNNFVGPPSSDNSHKRRYFHWH